MIKKKGIKSRPGRAAGQRRRLNIAEMHWGYPPIIGGVETHLAMMLPMMVEMGHSVHLLTGSVENKKVEYEDRGVKIRRTPLMDLNWLFKRGLEGLEPELFSLFNSFIDAAKPDVMHVHNMHYFSKPHATMLEEICHTRGIPIALTAHNVWDDVLYLELTRNIKWDHIIAVSHYIRRELIGAGCTDDQVTPIHHGVDTSFFRPDADTRATYKKYPQLKGRKVVFHPFHKYMYFFRMQSRLPYILSQILLTFQDQNPPFLPKLDENICKNYNPCFQDLLLILEDNCRRVFYLI